MSAKGAAMAYIGGLDPHHHLDTAGTTELSEARRRSNIMLHLERVHGVLRKLKFQDWKFVAAERGGMVYIKATWAAPCNVTGTPSQQVSRRWLIRPEASEMEIVQTAFKLVITALEHEAREQFAWHGRAVLGPHQNLDQLWYNAVEVV